MRPLRSIVMAFALMLLAGIGAEPLFADAAPADPVLPLSRAEADSAATALVSAYYDRVMADIDPAQAADSAFISGFTATVDWLARINPSGRYLNGAQVALVILSSSLMMQDMNVPIPSADIIRAFTHAARNGRPDMSPDAATAYMRSLVMKRNGADGPEMADPEAETRLIEQAAATPGATILPSGTVFIPIAAGVGTSPAPGDEIEFTYIGRLSDGYVFDDATDEPVRARVGQLVPGFNEALTRMLPGGTYRIVIPPDAAYGADGIPGVIPGGSALDFTVTLK